MYKFENPERPGADALKRAGYVEFDKFRSTVMGKISANKEPVGYFCAVCPYYQIKDDSVKGGACNKLKADVAAWGCCNLWEYKPMQFVQQPTQVDPTAQPEQPTPQGAQAAQPSPIDKQPEEPAQQASAPTAPNPVQKPVQKPVQAAVKPKVPAEPVPDETPEDPNLKKIKKPIRKIAPVRESSVDMLKRLIREELNKIKNI